MVNSPTMADKVENDAVPLEGQRYHQPHRHQQNEFLGQPALEETLEHLDKLTLHQDKVERTVEENTDSFSSTEGQQDSDEAGQVSNDAANPSVLTSHVVINNASNGIINLGPRVNFVVGPSYTQVNRMSTSEEGEPGHSGQYEREPPPLDFLRPLWYSTRVLSERDLLILSKNIGSNWKAVGNGLKFNWAQLEQFEKDTSSVADAVHKMLFRWLQWRDEKATIGKLTKILFNHQEYDAIRCLTA